ncbi:MAG: MFS transporter [Terrimicrobiaceae bacterium]|nr:MFS transporter [Terrimicrobiaceae bacterium]
MSDPLPKTVQEYIDETPNWQDGTRVADVPMTAMQWRIWMLATAGKFFEGLVVFMTGVALPLIVLEFQLDPARKGMVSAATLAGILVGATALGGLSDRVGRKSIFILEMALFVAFLVVVTMSDDFAWLVVGLFGVGLALGCDYPTAHLVISESIPSGVRGRLVLGAFGFQALGALVGTALGFLILKSDRSIADWRMMYATAIGPAVLVTVGRFFIPQSGHWLVAQGRIAEAERETAKLLHRQPAYPARIRLRLPHSGHNAGAHKSRTGYARLFDARNRRATILASAPWFLQDLATYGIGIFTPTILASTLGGSTGGPARNLADVIHADMYAAKGAAFLDVLLLVGIVGAVLLADRVGRICLQVLGFLGCAAGLFLAALSVHFDGTVKMVCLFAGFMLFNFMTNLGPNAMTYLIAGEVFPTGIRGMGAGFAASFAKIGAVLTAFLFPILLKDIGVDTLLYGLVAASLAGALITWRFGIETAGVNLETVGSGSRPDD